MPSNQNIGTEVMEKIKSATNLLDSKPEQQKLNTEYEGVKSHYPKIDEQVKVAEQNNHEDNACLFKKTAVDHSHKMDDKYGENSDSKERKQEEGYFDSFVSKVCKFVNDHSKMVKAVKIASTVAAAVCGVAAVAFPPAAVGTVAFGAVAGAVTAIENVADKRKLKSMEEKVSKKGDEFTDLKAKIEAQEKAIMNLEQKLNSGATLESEMKHAKNSLPFVAQEDVKKLTAVLTQSMKQANDEIPNDSNLKEGAVRQNAEIAKLNHHSH